LIFSRHGKSQLSTTSKESAASKETNYFQQTNYFQKRTTSNLAIPSRICSPKHLDLAAWGCVFQQLRMVTPGASDETAAGPKHELIEPGYEQFKRMQFFYDC
jgi:hypothetical protein